MTGETMLRSASDLMRLRSTFAVLDRLSAHAPDLVVVRGSAAVFAHAPALARVPNDLDVFWLGADADVRDLVREISRGPGVVILGTRVVAPPDPRLSGLKRVDVLVWLTATRRPSHRMWVDIGTSRRMVRADVVNVALTPRTVTQARVAPLLDVLAEKLFVYVESAQRERADLRWTDLFDMLALLRGAPALRCLDPSDVRVACILYFAGRDRGLAGSLPPPPREWRAAWYRLVGPIRRDLPDLERAYAAAREFWGTVLRDDRSSHGLRWDPKAWRWTRDAGVEDPRNEPRRSVGHDRSLPADRTISASTGSGIG